MSYDTRGLFGRLEEDFVRKSTDSSGNGAAPINIFESAWNKNWDTEAALLELASDTLDVLNTVMHPVVSITTPWGNPKRFPACVNVLKY